ncbi:MAG: hypothetical protein K6C36_01585 [Clostridia bacterium]|nr:hypothetical protein [Clostridia bacterium]
MSVPDSYWDVTAIFAKYGALCFLASVLIGVGIFLIIAPDIAAKLSLKKKKFVVEEYDAAIIARRIRKIGIAMIILVFIILVICTWAVFDA